MPMRQGANPVSIQCCFLSTVCMVMGDSTKPINQRVAPSVPAFERLDPYEVKGSSTVLRELGDGNIPWLLGRVESVASMLGRYNQNPFWS